MKKRESKIENRKWETSGRFVLKTAGVLDLSDDELLRLCETNDGVQIEQDPDGTLIFMPPSGFGPSSRNSDLVYELKHWNRRTEEKGHVTGPDGGFRLPNGALRAPDAAWIPSERWNQFTPDEREKFLSLCPDFVIELRSSTDRLADLQDKMAEYVANGCRLGWLIDPYEEQAFVYQPDAEPERIDSFDEVLSGEDVLPGFTLNLSVLR